MGLPSLYKSSFRETLEFDSPEVLLTWVSTHLSSAYSSSAHMSSTHRSSTHLSVYSSELLIDAAHISSTHLSFCSHEFLLIWALYSSELSSHEFNSSEFLLNWTLLIWAHLTWVQLTWVQIVSAHGKLYNLYKLAIKIDKNLATKSDKNLTTFEVHRTSLGVHWISGKSHLTRQSGRYSEVTKLQQPKFRISCTMYMRRWVDSSHLL